jgi:hypothetical protein
VLLVLTTACTGRRSPRSQIPTVVTFTVSESGCNVRGGGEGGGDGGREGREEEKEQNREGRGRGRRRRKMSMDMEMEKR